MIDTDKKVILVVEDDSALRAALHDKLTIKGFFPVEARSGEEGLQFAKRDRPDLILLDILMPEMDGLAMMKKLREVDAWGKQVPIVLLTNLTADTQEIREAVAEGAPTQYLIKSDWTIDQVVEKVKEALS
ncbi:MAG: response regulator [Candidatus Paceibacterota bacterium]